jgi:hypothetical protein
MDEEEPNVVAKLGGVTRVLPRVDSNWRGGTPLAKGSLQEDLNIVLQSAGLKIVDHDEFLRLEKGSAVVNLSIEVVSNASSSAVATNVKLRCVRPMRVDGGALIALATVWEASALEIVAPQNLVSATSRLARLHALRLVRDLRVANDKSRSRRDGVSL